MMAFGSNKALNSVAEYKDISLAAWRIFRSDFFFIHFCPRILKPDVPNILRILTACPFDSVFHFHSVLICTAQERVVCATSCSPARMLIVIRSFERVKKCAVDAQRMIVSQRVPRRLQYKKSDKTLSHTMLHPAAAFCAARSSLKVMRFPRPYGVSDAFKC
jgi:hypothetical protein